MSDIKRVRKTGTITDYLRACCKEADYRDAKARKERADKQEKCKHKNLSGERHLGMGLMSQTCYDCGKSFSWYDRG